MHDDLIGRVGELTDPLALAFLDREQKWLSKARDKQVLPIDGWNLAIARAGRGWGKTEVGANWIVRQAGLYPGIIIHAVAPSHADLTGTMFNGISGIVAVCPPELIESVNVSAAIPVIKFRNGSIVRGFSAQSPERLRGPQCTMLWGDEIAAWAANGKQKAKDTLSNIDMSTRIAYKCADGTLVQPQKLYTTTPKPLDWLAKLIKRADIEIIGSTYENRENLAEDFFRDIQQYEGTEIGRQEIYGEMLDPGEAAIIKRSWLRLWPHDKALPWFDYIMIVMDTALTEKTFDKKEFKADPTACQVWGVFSHDRRWNMMLLQHWKDHVGMPELIKRAKQELKHVYGSRDLPSFGNPILGETFSAAYQEKRPDILIVEDKGSGISLRQMLANEGIECFPYNPGKADKLSRLHGSSHVASGGPDRDGVFRGTRGRCWLLESDMSKPDKHGHGGPGNPKSWYEPCLAEVCTYSGPGTTEHDDDVDCWSMASRFFADNWMTAGYEGMHVADSQKVHFNMATGDNPEFIDGEDHIPGDLSRYDEELTNPYG
jgi:hypothetical protein